MIESAAESVEVSQRKAIEKEGNMKVLDSPNKGIWKAEF